MRDFVFFTSLVTILKISLILHLKVHSKTYNSFLHMKALNTHIPPCLKKQKQSGYEIWSVNRTRETFFLKYHTQKVVKKLFTDPFLKNQN